jgi:hypothetical protein
VCLPNVHMSSNKASSLNELNTILQRLRTLSIKATSSTVLHVEAYDDLKQEVLTHVGMFSFSSILLISSCSLTCRDIFSCV